MGIRIFAYGSNLSSTQQLERTPSAEFVMKAKLEGHALRFHKHGSLDGTAKADAFETGRKDDVVWGVVYEMSEPDAARLDAREGGYDRNGVTVVDEQGHAHDVDVYRAQEDRIDRSLTPRSIYIETVITGAEEHGLPEEYIDGIRALRKRATED